MSSLPRTSLSLITLAWIYYHLDGHLRRANPVIADGRVDTGYESVREAFLKNFEDGWEHEGASLAVFVDGKPVVDLWGGYADSQAARKWREDTISVTFSTTKAVAAACIALLVDRGRLSYDDLVSKHWPGFAKNGKENVTVHQVLAHMGGLGYINAKITEEIARDHVAMRQIIENEEPKWKPGSAIGYHPYTYGWLVDQLVRHTDEKARGIGQFLREEITGPYGIDYHIGLPFSEAWRVARLHTPTMWERVREVFHNWRVLWCFRHLWSLQMDTPLSRAVNNPNWLQAVHRATYNNPEYHNMEQAAALGIGNARSLAQIFNLFVTEKLVGHKTLKHLEQHYANDEDIIFGGRSTKGHGFFYLPLDRAGTQHLIGHTGHGCQNVGYDLKNRIVIAYVTNGLKTGVYDLCRNYIRLQHAVYDVIEKNLQ